MTPAADLSADDLRAWALERMIARALALIVLGLHAGCA